MNLTPKQKEVMDSFIKENPKILLASGAKRAGKTFVFILLFLMHIAKYEGQGLSFIIGGATQASIRRNILNDMESVLGKELKLNKVHGLSEKVLSKIHNGLFNHRHIHLTITNKVLQKQ